jgi:hypothetical protein
MAKQHKLWNLRKIHLWIGIIVAIPLILIAITGFLISARSVMNISIPMSWTGKEAIERLPLTAFTQTKDGTAWIGNSQGLYSIQNDNVIKIPDFEGQEIVALVSLYEFLEPIVATKMAIWHYQNNKWTAVKRGRVRELLILSDGSVLGISGGIGELADSKPFITKDGVTWQPYILAMKANEQLPKIDNPKIPLHQFMREIHSGVYFFGKGSGEIIWNGFFGFIILVVSFSGLLIWYKRKRNRNLN